MPCFDACGCTCNVLAPEFDKIVKRETRFGISLRQVLDSHAGWYFDDDDGRFPGDVESLQLARTPGVYILWQQDGYCEDHQTEHLRAFYVGKAGRGVESRLKAHQATKRIGNELSVEISLWAADNRRAKYVEQLLLDLYDFPMNTAENSGTELLCHHVPPGEWN